MVSLRAASWAVVVGLAAVGPARAEWFTSEEGRITVALPGQPAASRQVVPTPAGNVTVHVFTFQYPNGTGEAAVTYTDFPPQALAGKTTDAMLDGSVNGSIQGMKGTLVRSSKITQAGAPGREFTWTAQGPGGKLAGHGRIFLVGDRLYQVIVVGVEARFDPQVSEAACKTLEFKPAPGTPAAATAKAAATKGAATKGAMRKPTATAAARVPWVTHTGVSYEGLWHVDMPREPRTSKEPGMFGVKDRNVRVASDGKLTYTLKIQVVPDRVLDEGAEPVLAAARDRLAEEAGGKVVEESDAPLAGRDGHAYQLDVAGPKPSAVAARAALCGKRLVVLSVAGDPKLVAGPSTGRFFESFTTDR